MKTRERILSFALCGALILTANGALSAETWSPPSMKPLMAISLDSGTKHVVSYFLPSEGRCDLTLMIAVRPSIDDTHSSESVERLAGVR